MWQLFLRQAALRGLGDWRALSAKYDRRSRSGGFPARGLALGHTAARGFGGRRVAGVSGTDSGEEKRVGCEGSRRANSPLQNAREE